MSTTSKAANKWVGEFYDLKADIDRVFSDIRAARTIEEANAIRKENRALLGARKRLTKMGEQIGGLNQQINDICVFRAT